MVHFDPNTGTYNLDELRNYMLTLGAEDTNRKNIEEYM
jgi:hypothetical protein